jgi:Ca2+-binding EF-hand superfamily protein
MRSFFLAIGFVTLISATASAQLLGGAPKKPADDPDGKAVPGRAAGDAKQNAGAKAGKSAPAAPQRNVMFDVIDVNADGIISKTELRKAIKALQSLDADTDGNITLAEASIGGGAVAPGGAIGNNPQIAQLMANDLNKDGKLTVNEVPPQMAAMLGGVDRNNDNAIDEAELQNAMAAMRNIPGGPWNNNQGGNVAGGGNANEATGQFLRYDRNGDGKLSADELPREAKGILKGADRDGDGSIDAGELQAALAQQGSRARALRGGVDVSDPRGRETARARKAAGN